MGKKNKRLYIIFSILSVLIVLTFFSAKKSQSDFNSAINSKFTEQKLSFSYYLKNGKSNFKLILGDLNGLNFNTYEVLTKTVKKTFNDNNSIIIIPSIFAAKSSANPGKINQEIFMDSISNDNGVVIVDNFCTENWQNSSSTSYTYAPLSKGKFCQSEKETQDLQKVISSYGIKEAAIIYDTDAYLSFVDNFLLFLKENNINYKLIKSENEEQIINEIQPI
jgi:hypothetical protein